MHSDSLLDNADYVAGSLIESVGMIDTCLRDEPDLAEACPAVPALRVLLAAAAQHLSDMEQGIEPDASPELDAAMDELRRTYHSQGVEY